MDMMVVKYLALAGVTYGTHAYLAVTQLFLALYLITSGIVLLSSRVKLGKWAERFGLVINPSNRKKRMKCWLMITTGVLLLLPLFGVSYWIAVLACPITLFFILQMTTGMARVTSGNVMRKGMAVSVVLIFCFTIWEGRDLVFAGFDVNYKAISWRHKEVSVWQKDNNPNVPKIGDMAPDFELSDYTGKTTVRLSDYRGEKPVVLLFGSFT